MDTHTAKIKNRMKRSFTINYIGTPRTLIELDTEACRWFGWMNRTVMLYSTNLYKHDYRIKWFLCPLSFDTFGFIDGVLVATDHIDMEANTKRFFFHKGNEIDLLMELPSHTHSIEVEMMLNHIELQSCQG